MTNPVYPIVVVRTAQASVVGLLGHLLLHWPLTGPHALGLFVTPALCVYFVFAFYAPWTWGLPILTRFSTRERTLALTFDDGPSPHTERILDILQAHGAQATFFVLGEQARRFPHLIRRMAAEGHAIGLHGETHRALVLASPGDVRGELARAAQSVREACGPAGAQCVWFRPPHGFKSVTLPFVARRAGYKMAAWSVNGRDYAPSQTPQGVALRVLREARPGMVALLHDGPGQSAAMEALPLLLDGLRARGLRCVSLP